MFGGLEAYEATAGQRPVAPRQAATVGRPKAGVDRAEIIAPKRPLTACGKLRGISNHPAESQGVHQMSLDDVRAVYRDVFVA
jgi:hypothetical protein